MLWIKRNMRIFKDSENLGGIAGWHPLGHQLQKIILNFSLVLIGMLVYPS